LAEEFVDLYQVLDLPLDADRGTVRKRINELYLDAQRNIDHRNFATRVKFQELFEVTLPQARYILLDDGRRDEYNRIVNSFRAASGASGAPTAPPTETSDAIPQSTGGFSLEIAADSIPGSAPPIAPLPQSTASDPVQEREELWKKWKSGLEAALTVEDGDKPKSRAAATSAPTSFSPLATPDAAPAATPAAPVSVPVAPLVTESEPAPAAPKAPPRPKVEISFDFGGDNAPRPGESAPAPGAEEIVAQHKQQHSAEEIEARRTEHRREVTKEILVNVGLIWGISGALLVIVPGVIALIAAVAHYYPRGAKPLLGYSSMVLWIGGFLLMGVAAFFASRELSKAMRRTKAMEMSQLSYEELLRRHGKT